MSASSFFKKYEEKMGLCMCPSAPVFSCSLISQ